MVVKPCENSQHDNMEGSDYVPDGINNRYIPANYTRPLYYTLRPPHQMDLQNKDKKLPPIFPVKMCTVLILQRCKASGQFPNTCWRYTDPV